MYTESEQLLSQRRQTNVQKIDEKVINNINHQENENQSHKETLDTLGCLFSKREEITRTGENTEEKENVYTVGRNVKWYNYYGKEYGDFSRT